MRIVIAPDKFKGCLSAAEVAGAIGRGLLLADASVQTDSCPMADGGEGTVAALVAATGGRIVQRVVTGPLVGMKVEAAFGMAGDGRTAVIEMAAASGLALLPAEQRNPLRTTTYGTGELIMHAAGLGARRIILGIGGSATTDGGIGCAQACGAAITLESGATYRAGDRRLTGSDVAGVLRVDGPVRASADRSSAAEKPKAAEGPDLSAIEFIVACDVGNPLFGPDGAAPIFSPQKGATPQQVAFLDMALEKLAQRTGKLALAQTAGAGAAGGLGFGMMAFFGAELRSGIEIVIEATGLRRRLESADLCITGEGRLDAQSLGGKTAIGVARACKAAGVPCIALVGSVGEGAEAALGEGLGAWMSICDGPMSLERAMAEAGTLLERAAATAMRMVRVVR